MTALSILSSICVVVILWSSSSCMCRAEDPVIQHITDPRALSEEPHWDGEFLYYVDALGCVVYRHNIHDNTEKSITFDKTIGMFVPVKGETNKFVVGLGMDLVLVTCDWDSCTSSSLLIVSLPMEHATNRLDDGKADESGRIWTGTMGRMDATSAEVNKASFYVVDSIVSEQCQAVPVVRPVSVSNGLAWSHDNKKLYYIDSLTRRVDVFDFNLAEGKIHNQKTVFDFEQLGGMMYPDGMTIDKAGCLWIACYNGSQVIHVDPTTGKLLRQIKMPVMHPTSVVFGGPNLDTLFVTSMRAGLTEDQLKTQPHAGAVFKITNLKATGTPSKPAVVNCKCAN